jgi:pyrroloquinoline quinone biosynthesis protein D
VNARVKIAAKARLKWDARDAKHVLLSPERGLVLSETAARVLELCDGSRTKDAIIDLLASEYGADRAVVARDVEELFAQLRARALLEET